VEHSKFRNASLVAFSFLPMVDTPWCFLDPRSYVCQKWFGLNVLFAVGIDLASGTIIFPHHFLGWANPQ